VQKDTHEDGRTGKGVQDVKRLSPGATVVDARAFWGGCTQLWLAGAVSVAGLRGNGTGVSSAVRVTPHWNRSTDGVISPGKVITPTTNASMKYSVLLCLAASLLLLSACTTVNEKKADPTRSSTTTTAETIAPAPVTTTTTTEKTTTPSPVSTTTTETHSN
jgi:hypothetical protein